MNDIEKNQDAVSTASYVKQEAPAYDDEPSAIGSVHEHKNGKWQNFKDSFKPADLSQYDTSGMTEVEKAALATANSPLSRGLKPRHLQMIAIGGSIGTGLFVGSGTSLATGGPAALLIAYGIIGVMLFCTVHALGELACTFPVAGSFATYSTRFIHPAWGFAMGWNYTMSWFVVLPLELVAASITVNFWQDMNGTNINNAAWIAIFWVLIVCINLFGVKGYGEAEFVFSLTKVVAILGFCILGIVLCAGGGPKGGYIGGKWWHRLPEGTVGPRGGAFAHAFKGVCATFVSAAFAFTGTELVGLAAAETENPRKMLPSATKQVFWRILIFYIVSLTLVGLLVPFDDPHLLKGSSSVDATASPFVIAIRNAGISGLPSVMNVVIMIAVLSVGNSAVYGFSRTIAGLAAMGHAPKWFAYIDRQGRPIVGILVVSFWGLFAFICAAPVKTQNAVFGWLMALSGLASIFTWGSINLCHIRFRLALKRQGRTTKELAFTAALGIWGSVLGLTLNCLVLIAQFWIALFPIGAPKPTAEAFFNAYLAAPVVLFFALVWLVWKRDPWLTIDKLDIDTGRRETDLVKLEAELEQERYELAQRKWYYRIYKTWC